MLLTILSHVVAALAGGGGVFVYLYKHQTAAADLAKAVNEGKTLLDDAKNVVKKL